MSLQAQADADYAYILELIRDYLALVNTVKVDTPLSLTLHHVLLSGGAWRESQVFPGLADCSQHSPQEERAEIKNGAWRSS